MNLSTIKVTQRHIRHEKEKIFALSEYAKTKTFTNCSKIAIIDTSDGNFWIRDGLHRCCAIYLAKRPIQQEEFTLEYYSYKDIDSINIEAKYYTPFDLRKEVRLENLLAFKEMVQNLCPNHLSVIEFIKNNPGLYKTQRQQFHDSLESFIMEIL